jgi:hypothetical protein
LNKTPALQGIRRSWINDACWRFHEHSNAPLIAAFHEIRRPSVFGYSAILGVWDRFHLSLEDPKMSSQPAPKPTPDSPYCSDPNCEYCKDLRAAEEQLKNGYPVTPAKKGSPSDKKWNSNT